MRPRLVTVRALLVPAGTIFFRRFLLRVVFKRGYNSRAGTITEIHSQPFNLAKKWPKNVLFRYEI